MADKWCGSPHPPKMAWAKMREFCWKFTWWCFWVSLFWITSYIYIYIWTSKYIYLLLYSNNLIYLILYRWTKRWSDKHYIFMFHITGYPPQFQVFWVHRWYRFTWYTHTGSWGSSPLVISKIFPDPSANYGEFLILMIGEWLMKVIIWRCYQSVSWSTLCLSTYFSPRPTVQFFYNVSNLGGVFNHMFILPSAHWQSKFLVCMFLQEAFLLRSSKKQTSSLQKKAATFSKSLKHP